MSIEDEKEAGQRAAQDYFDRYGQEAVLLRASRIVARRGGEEGVAYALGFWLQACKLAGFNPQESDA